MARANEARPVRGAILNPSAAALKMKQSEAAMSYLRLRIFKEALLRDLDKE